LSKKSQITTAQILSAALNVAADQGAGKVTLDAVAKASGLSKGGLLYHFPTKEALISAMIQQLIDETETSRLALMQQGDNVLAAVIKAHANFSSQVKGNTAMAILAAAADQPALLAPVQQISRKVMHEIAEASGDNSEALMLLLASEAMIFQELLHISPFSSEQKANLDRYMLSRAQELIK